jgi:hypothetical protein
LVYRYIAGWWFLVGSLDRWHGLGERRANGDIRACRTKHDEADHDEERAARKVHLLLSEIPTPAWQDIVMDRAAWNKMLRRIYTN